MIRFLLFLLFATPALADSQEVRFHHDGQNRRFQLTLPEASDGPVPLILVLHGAFQTDKRMIETTRGQFDRIAERDGVAVAYPNGIQRLWDIGQGAGAAEMKPRRDDLGYLDKVIAAVASQVVIDPDRIFMAGFSMGGQMTYSYACNRPGKIRAIATSGMPLPNDLIAACAPGQKLPGMIIHGTADPVVPFEGGDVPAGLGVSVDLASHDATVAFFAKRAGCRGSAIGDVIDAKADGTSVQISQGTGCDVPVVGVTINGMGHYWPGGGPDLPESLIGTPSVELNGATLVWSFFQQVAPR